MMRVLAACAVVAALSMPLAAADQPKVFIEPVENGFHTYIIAAIHKKKVPVLVLEDASKADFTLKAVVPEVEKVGTGHKVINCLFAYCAGNENKAATSVSLTKDGAIVWSYSVNKGRGAKNMQSMAEAIAKHLHNDFFKKQR